MKEFTRQPTRGERALAVVLNSILASLAGALAVFLLYRDVPVGAAICGAITSIWLVLFYRAAFGIPRSLRHGEGRILAWVLLAAGVAGLLIAIFLVGPAHRRLMLMGGSISLLSAGIAGVRSRRQDA